MGHKKKGPDPRLSELLHSTSPAKKRKLLCSIPPKDTDPELGASVVELMLAGAQKEQRTAAQNTKNAVQPRSKDKEIAAVKKIMRRDKHGDVPFKNFLNNAVGGSIEGLRVTYHLSSNSYILTLTDGASLKPLKRKFATLRGWYSLS